MHGSRVVILGYLLVATTFASCASDAGTTDPSTGSGSGSGPVTASGDHVEPSPGPETGAPEPTPPEAASPRPDTDPIEVAGARPCSAAPRAPYRTTDDVDGIGDGDLIAAVDCLVALDVIAEPLYDGLRADEPIAVGELGDLVDAFAQVARGAAVTLAGDAADSPGDTGDLAEGDGADSDAAVVTWAALAAAVVELYEAVAGTEPERGALDAASEGRPDPAIEQAVGLGIVEAVIADASEHVAELDRGEVFEVLARLVVRLDRDGFAPDGGWPIAGYDARVHMLPPGLVEDARAWTWNGSCPVHLDDLRLLEVVFRDLDRHDRWGQLVVHADVAAEVAGLFGRLHGDGFAIERMEPIERFEGDDGASMAANNTSAFNCRPSTGSDRWSEHAYGWAIDINPARNPYVRGDTVLPGAGRDFLDRSDVRPGMLVRPGPVEHVDAIDWGWGGDWTSLKDHQHISLTGR